MVQSDHYYLGLDGNLYLNPIIVGRDYRLDFQQLTIVRGFNKSRDLKHMFVRVLKTLQLCYSFVDKRPIDSGQRDCKMSLVILSPIPFYFLTSHGGMFSKDHKAEGTFHLFDKDIN